MNLRESVLDALRTGRLIERIAEHYSISERDILQIVANEMSAKLPNHLVQYLRLEEMETLWAEYACRNSMPPSESWNILQAQRERFHLAMEREVRRVTGVNSHPEIRPMVAAFKETLQKVADPPVSKVQKARKGKKR